MNSQDLIQKVKKKTECDYCGAKLSIKTENRAVSGILLSILSLIFALTDFNFIPIILRMVLAIGSAALAFYYLAIKMVVRGYYCKVCGKFTELKN